jgi:phosphate acyltransferase
VSENELPIALDAMGGDHAPAEIVRGAVRAAREHGVRVALVGQRDVIQRELKQASGSDQGVLEAISVVDASEVIAMDEHPAQAVRAKKDASLVVACRLVAEGKARATVSAGNSGAVLAASLFTVKRIRGVARPAIGASLPTSKGRCFLLDVGANADCRPEWLAQFALMGSIYANTMMDVRAPGVGLLSNGEELGKGSELVRASTPLLEAAPVRYIGNVEGKDIFAGKADVVVTDGFTGNVALKMAEGVAEFLFSSIRQEASKSLTGKVGGALLKPRLRPLRDQVDWRATGGALLLGVDGEVVIAHGRSDAVAIANALRVARDAADRSVHTVIAQNLGTLATSEEPEATAEASLRR